MRTIRFTLNGFPASVTLPEHFFDEKGVPRWHLLNSRFAQAFIVWDKPVGGVPVDEEVVVQPTTPITEEVTKLREILESLEKKSLPL